MQSSAQEVTMLSKLIAAAEDSWACYNELLHRIHTGTSITYVKKV